VKSVDGGVLVRYHAHLLKQIAEGRWTTKTASHYFAGVKTWVNWLYDTEAIQSIPRGIKRLVIRRYAPPIKTFGLDQIKLLLSKASLRTRLYCLLALNCGLYQSDVATLRRDEVDLKAGTITRRRTKTRHLPNPPVVTYVLWTATKNALAEHMAADGDLALLGEGGLSLLRKEVTAEGKLKKTDAIKSAFDRLLLKTKLTGSYKLLRKTSASLLADSQWPDVVDLFLGHAAAKISDKHYAQAAQGRLRDALEWLRGRYGV
jgi:integrase